MFCYVFVLLPSSLTRFSLLRLSSECCDQPPDEDATILGFSLQDLPAISDVDMHDNGMQILTI